MKKYFYELMTDSRCGLLDKAMQGVLWVFSLVYGFLAELMRAMYQDRLLSVYRSPKAVVSVGNITTGGVGKTPLVIWLVKALSQKGLKVVVLSRGYGASEGLNDETKMFKEILPQVSIVTGKSRKKSIQKALAEEQVDIFVADDAFSHWPLARDLDIVVIDAANPFGNGYLIPRGILREKKESIIRADILILTKTEKVQNTRQLCQELRQINSRALIVESKHVARCFRNIFTKETYDCSSFNGQQAFGFCAIGDPSSFEFTIQKTGLALVKGFTFMDHYQYTEEDLKQIIDSAKAENISILVTTHKDAVKLTFFKDLFKGLTVLSLDIELEITQGQDEIIQRIISLRRS